MIFLKISKSVGSLVLDWDFFFLYNIWFLEPVQCYWALVADQLFGENPGLWHDHKKIDCSLSPTVRQWSENHSGLEAQQVDANKCLEAVSVPWSFVLTPSTVLPLSSPDCLLSAWSNWQSRGHVELYCLCFHHLHPGGVVFYSHVPKWYVFHIVLHNQQWAFIIAPVLNTGANNMPTSQNRMFQFTHRRVELQA